MATRIGEVIELSSSAPGSQIPTVQALEPRSAQAARPHQYSGVYGFNEFPLHTDLAHWARPPRYLLLRCLRGDKDVATRVLSADDFIEAIGMDLLERSLFKPRRPSRFGTPALLTSIFKIDSVTGLRWDQLFLTPMNSEAEEAKIRASQIRELGPLHEFHLRDLGDILLIDNWRMLHGRGPVSSAVRIIERVYLSELKQ
ncbi:TauD/TfdA family dioxygenase [Rhizobium leguminosarum]|uniref:TauD/TfdA family dioxygenase n=1 Tax=Rhizobium leguminosarum TaxID=384 RepID=UPI001FE13015